MPSFPKSDISDSIKVIENYNFIKIHKTKIKKKVKLNILNDFD